MPNWCTVIIKAKTKEEFLKIKEMLLNNGKVDFNNIIPMPKELDILCQDIPKGFSIKQQREIKEKANAQYNDKISQEEFLQNTLKELKKDEEIKSIIEDKTQMFMDKNMVEEYIKGIFNEKRYGYKDWYEWSTKNWGTKWNAGETNINENKMLIAFDTAWTPPKPILEKIAKQADFRVYVSEESGSYDKIMEAKNKKLILVKELSIKSTGEEIKRVEKEFNYLSFLLNQRLDDPKEN